MKPILDQDTQDRLLNLAPEVLFLGTRYLGPMLTHCYIWPIGSERPRLFTCPEWAAAIALAPAPWDCGRGAIIAVDKSTFTRPRTLIATDDPSEYVCPSAVISHHVVGMYWLDELVPGAGVSTVNIDGPGTVELLSHARMSDAYWHVRECEERGVSLSEIRPVEDMFENYGFLCPDGPFADVFLVATPGEPRVGDHNARHFLREGWE